MKWFIASDIHGSAYYCKKMLKAFEKEKADRILLLGDFLYHGPRNELPRDYNPKEVISLLNSLSEKILCVRGNCDSEVDQMVLNFPIMADYAFMSTDKNIIFVTHGHIYNEENMPSVQSGDIILHGHTHIPRCEKHSNILFLNPGSVSIPKNGSHHSYMTFEDNTFIWKSLDAIEYNKYIIG